MYLKAQKTLLLSALCSRVALLLLLCLPLGEDDNTSAQAYLGLAEKRTPIQQALLSLLRWDAIHMCSIAEKGYCYESQHAFFPFYPLLIRIVCAGILPFLSQDTSLLLRRRLIVLVAAAISNASSVGAALLLFHLAAEITNSAQLSFAAAILFLAQPATIFLAAPYTESLFALFCFGGMLLYERGCLNWAAICWFLSALTRSNGIVMGGFFIYAAMRRPRSVFGNMLRLVFVLSAFFLVDMHTKHRIHPELSFVGLLLDARRIEYFRLQEKYWNLGLLRYYTPAQFGNIIYAVPMVFFSAAGIAAYFVGLLEKSRSAFYSHRLFPYIAMWAAMLVYLLAVVHLNIVYRLFSFVPPIYLFAGHLLCTRNTLLPLYFCALWGGAAAVLFSRFYPPA